MSKPVDRIILNVGGIKYETYRDTLLTLPQSFLGTMFKDENSPMLKLENGNELFLDRNGRAFHYILEFYRTKEFFWRDCYDQIPSEDGLSRGCCASMITKEEIKSEIDFFQVPIELPSPPVIEEPNPYVVMLNKFINMIESLISTAKGLYINKINITFPCHSKPDFFVEPKIKMLYDILQPFSDCGFRIMQKYGKMIGMYIEEKDSGIKWECNISKPGWIDAQCIVKIDIDEKCDESFVVNNSILGNSIAIKNIKNLPPQPPQPPQSPQQ